MALIKIQAKKLTFTLAALFIVSVLPTNARAACSVGDATLKAREIASAMRLLEPEPINDPTPVTYAVLKTESPTKYQFVVDVGSHYQSRYTVEIGKITSCWMLSTKFERRQD